MSASMILSRPVLAASTLALAAALTTAAHAREEKRAMTTDEQIKTAQSAAPEAISKDATIAVHEDGKMRVLRTGTNEWTCMPDTLETPGVDPMCVDKNGMDWLHAYMQRKQPPSGKIGLAYMLAGGADASNTDPFAKDPSAGGKWIKTGPHIMILGAKVAEEGRSAATTPDTSKPFVMWAGTPYEHLMIPVK